LAWAASGCPARGIAGHDIELYRAASRLVESNGGRFHAGDVDRLVAIVERKGGQR
jgi:hypothetical protein